MATKPRFGRLPRSAPSLTSTIVSLAQQYQGDRNRNIETAWKEGGLFEGKKVTDEMFLKHWQGRLAEVSPGDPMWDYYNNLLYSYQFTIEESKMGLKYAEEKVSDGQMAAFYRQWAKKMPMNSQNYRQLMTQAAKFKAAATSRGYGRSSRASSEAYNNRQQATYNQHEAPYDVAISILARYAVDANLLDANDLNDPDYGWSKLTNSAGENDPNNFANLLEQLSEDPEIMKGISAVIGQYDKTFSGVLNEESLALLANNARNGAMTRGRRANQAGDTAYAKKADKAADQYAKSSMVIRATLGPNGKDNGFVEQNEAMRAEMDAKLSPNSGASPSERAMAIQRYQNWLAGDGATHLMRSFPPGSFDPLSANYNPYASGLMGRVKGTVSVLSGESTGKTLKDDLFGFDTESPGKESDAVTLSTTVKGLYTGLQNVAAGKSIVVRTNDRDEIDSDGGGWAIFSREDPELANRDLVPFSASVPGMPGGEVRYTEALPVRAKVSGAVDPRTGAGVVDMNAIETEDEVIGSRVTIRVGGIDYVQYGVYQNGMRSWTFVDPFSAAGRGNEGRDGEGYTIAYAVPGGAGVGQVTGQYSPKGFLDPTAAKRNLNGVDSTDGTKWDPNTDKETGFGSPMASFANTSSDTMRFVANMSAQTVANGEREWYSKPENQTPEMKAAIQGGADPRAVIEEESNKLLRTIQFNRQYGFTPEDQSRNRKRENEFMKQRAAAEAGTTVEELDKQNARSDIVSGLNKWGLAEREKELPRGPLDNRPRGPYGEVEGVQPSTPEFMRKGWNVGDLLNQPGMSLEQANDLAYQISHGAVGKPGQGQVVPQVSGGPQITGGPRVSGGPRVTGGPTVTTNATRPYVNPFAASPTKPPPPKDPLAGKKADDIIKPKAANLPAVRIEGGKKRTTGRAGPRKVQPINAAPPGFKYGPR